MLNGYPDIMSVTQLADALGISKNTAYKLLKKHLIGYKRIGRKYLIPKACVIDFIQSAKYTIATE